jgi:hypothetical protein
MAGFLIGVLPVGVRAGSPIFLFAACIGGAGKLSSSTELCDSVDLRFFDRVGAMILAMKHSGTCKFVRMFDAIAFNEKIELKPSVFYEVGRKWFRD